MRKVALNGQCEFCTVRIDRLILPAKSGQEESSKEYDTNESKGMPALLGADSERTIDFGLEETEAASASSKAARHHTKRERVLRNILIV